MYEFIKEHYLLLLSIVFGVFITTAWMLFRGAGNVGQGFVSTAQMELESIRVQQQSIAGEVKESRERINDSRREVGELADYARSNAELIDESQRLVEEIERRFQERANKK